MDETICCLCGCKIEGWGNNALPLKEGTCCDVCNMQVIQARIAMIYGNKKEGEE